MPKRKSAVLRRNAPFPVEAAQSPAGSDESSPRPAPLQQLAYDEVKRLIVSGAFAPGAFLSERRLGERLGMSKTPIHAALERLEAESFISISPQQGVVVREVSLSEIVEYYEMRQAMDSFVVQKLAGRLIPEQVQALRTSLAQQKQAIEAKSCREEVEHDLDFHSQFYRYAGNQLMLHFIEQGAMRVQQIMIQALNADPRRGNEALAEHAEIVDAVVAGDGARAALLAVDHLERGKRVLLRTP